MRYDGRERNDWLDSRMLSLTVNGWEGVIPYMVRTGPSWKEPQGGFLSQ